MYGPIDREQEQHQRDVVAQSVTPAHSSAGLLAARLPLRADGPGLWGEVTLPYESVELLCDICRAHGTEPYFRAHRPSLTAAEKDSIVAPARVQKTVTIELGGRFVLCTAIGDAILSRALLRELAERLGLARAAAKKLHVNPPKLDPMACLEMAPGMVSPFLRPGRETAIRAVVLTDGSVADGPPERGLVAVSLSLRWSLLLDAARFPVILRDYARRAYPKIEWIDLRGHGKASPCGD
ncbi:MAG: hypothetical protein EPN57_12950 [Paraburkholderia sp.]|nr:MAG: hypothetical protein EPN57_12950 [Paraburkholderia sp.]